MTDFREMAKGLLTLEINTVEKDGMSGQKMPSAPNALIEVAQVYWDFLCQKSQAFGVTGSKLPSWSNKLSKSFDWGREPFPQPGAKDRPIAHPEGEPQPPGHNADFLKEPPATVTLDTLDHLREIAAWLAEMQLRTTSVADASSTLFPGVRDRLKPNELNQARSAARRFRLEERSIFHRIRRNCDQFKELTKRKGFEQISRSTPCEGFNSNDVVQIRKAWDMGVEIILMQTVIQIDGDVVNRFQSGMDVASKAPLHALHAGAVDLSFKYWRWLIDAFGRIAGTAVSSLLGSKG